MTKTTKLIVTSWNTSEASAWISRNLVEMKLATTTTDQFVLLVPPRDTTWAEEVDLGARVKVHQFGEDIYEADGSLSAASNGSLGQAEYIVYQLAFYANAYNVDGVLLVGTFHQNLNILARLMALPEGTLTAPIRAVVTSIGVNIQGDIASLVTDADRAVRDAYGQCERVFVSNRLSGGLIDSIDNCERVLLVAERVAQPFGIPENIEHARSRLEDMMGMRIPTHSTLVLAFHPTPARALEIVEQFKRIDEAHFAGDKLLLWIVQPNVDRAVADAIGDFLYIVYTPSKMATDIAIALLDAVNVLWSSDEFFENVASQRGKDILLEETFEPVIFTTVVSRPVGPERELLDFFA